MKFSQDGFGSRINITMKDSEVNTNDINKCFSMMSDFEKKYSRFIKGNFLHILNTKKSSPMNDELFQVLSISEKLSKLTNGNFDITILPLLENAGYGISDKKIPEQIGYKNIIFNKENIYLKNNISIDLGAIGKGYIVDKIYNFLDNKYNNYSINFGGDIRIKGNKKILLEDPLDENKALGEINISNLSIASSSGEKRKTQTGNHLIQALTKNSPEDILTIFVSHRICSLADAFSTALYVSPLQMSLEILNTTPGLEGMIITRSGEIFKTKNFGAKLYI